MKKIWGTVLLIAICLIHAVNISAAGPKEPVLEEDMPDCYGTAGKNPIVLYANAYSPDGGTLEYQWYSTTMNDMATIRAIDGAEEPTYIAPAEAGVTYYCFAVWNVWTGGLRSTPVYSRLIRVEYSEETPAPVSIEIQSTPDKVVYTCGERLDLTGLKVRIWMSDGYMDSVNGADLDIMDEPLVTIGEQKIKISYQGVYDFFIVTVQEKAHIHSFGEWMVTTAPTCTEPGIKARECDCGYTERAEVPAAGHRWDAGKITKEPTETVNGEKLYTCTVCQETRTETVKAQKTAGEASNRLDSSESSTSINSSESLTVTESGTIAQADPTREESGTSQSKTSFFTGWISVVIVVFMIVCCAAACGIIILIKRKK